MQATTTVEMAIQWTDFQSIRKGIDEYVSTWWSGPNIVLLIPKPDMATEMKRMLSDEGIKVFHPLQVKKILATGKRNDGGGNRQNDRSRGGGQGRGGNRGGDGNSNNSDRR
jgi:hypothetical protein